MTRPTLTRRAALATGLSAAFLGAGAGARAWAQGARPFADRKLVVVICRGAMDGLSVCPPIGDANYAGLRGAIAIPPDQALKLDETFALHPKLTALYALVQGGQARIAPAVAIPQRIRSHFEAQDMLENGSGQLYGAATGWLNRTLQVVQPHRPIKALSIGAEEPLILHGPVEAESWSPGGRLNPNGDRVTAAVQALYQDDPLLGPALATGLQVQSEANMLNGGKPINGGDAKAFAVTAAKFLTDPNGPSIAVLSLDGFDTHANQGAANGQLANRLAILDGVIAGLQTGLGAQWSQTVIVVATEFGRTAHVNGTGGTDHGTASTVILAGGALKPGGLIGDWPTLQPARLFENRDLAPTLDVRQVFKGVLRDHMGVETAALDTRVFPGSAAVRAVPGLVSA
jgi:uncharacterized protein (DUF1501 family)